MYRLFLRVLWPPFKKAQNSTNLSALRVPFTSPAMTHGSGTLILYTAEHKLETFLEVFFLGAIKRRTVHPDRGICSRRGKVEGRFFSRTQTCPPLPDLKWRSLVSKPSPLPSSPQPLTSLRIIFLRDFTNLHWYTTNTNPAPTGCFTSFSMNRGIASDAIIVYMINDCYEVNTTHFRGQVLL